MKNLFILCLTTCGLLFLGSCQQETVNSNANELATLDRAVPAEDEDVQQYLYNDERLPKSKVTTELLAAVAAHQASQNTTTNLDFRSPCAVACDGVEGESIFCEEFDGLTSGNVSEHSIHFEKWYPHAANDGQIVINHPNKFLKIQRNIHSQTHTLNEVDDILMLGDANQGSYTLHFEMYIGSYRTAYFDLQKQLRQEVLAAFEFDKFGGAKATFPDGQEVDFDYPVGEWFDVDITFNINNLPFNPTPPYSMIVIPNENTLTVDIAGQNLGRISTKSNILNTTSAGANQLQGVDFYPMFRSSKFYVDNICFSYLGDPALGN